MAEKTKKRNIRKRNNKKNTRKKNRNKTIKKKSLFTKKELSKINKIIHQLETDINFITSGTKKQVKDKTRKIRKDFDFLSTGIQYKKGQRGGASSKAWAGHIGVGVIIGWLGMLAFGIGVDDPSTLTNATDGSLNFLHLSQSLATSFFVMAARMASRVYFKMFTEMVMANMGCDRYVPQTKLSQEEIDEKNKSYYKFEDQIRTAGRYINSALMFYMMYQSASGLVSNTPNPNTSTGTGTSDPP